MLNIPILPRAFLTFARKSCGPSYAANKTCADFLETEFTSIVAEQEQEQEKEQNDQNEKGPPPGGA